MKWFERWLDKRVNVAQAEAVESLAQLHNLAPEQRQELFANACQDAQAHIDPAAATALSNQETAAFLSEPWEEQRRQQQEMQAAGQHLHALWETGSDVVITILALTPTGVVLGGQRQYEIEVLADNSGDLYRTIVKQLIPAPVISTYVVGAKFRGKADKQDRTIVGLFQPID